MHSYSVCKLISSTVLGFRIVTESGIAGNMLNIIGGCLSPAFRKFIRLKTPCMNVFPGFRIPEGSSSASTVMAASMSTLKSKVGLAGVTQKENGTLSMSGMES